MNLNTEFKDFPSGPFGIAHQLNTQESEENNNQSASDITHLPDEILLMIVAKTIQSPTLPLISKKLNSLCRERTLSYPLLSSALPLLRQMTGAENTSDAHDEVTKRIHSVWQGKIYPETHTAPLPTSSSITHYVTALSQYNNLKILFSAVHMHIRQRSSLAGKLMDEKEPLLRLQILREWFHENSEELAKLKGLNIQVSDMTEIPEELNYFKGLEQISFRGGKIRCIPHHLARDLPQLQSVDLRQNKIVSIAPGFSGNGNRIVKLMLDQNLIEELPEDFGVGMDSLTSLDLSFNKLKTVPASLEERLPDLYSLFLNNNQISSLPEEFGSSWPKLRFLQLKGNKLERLPPNLGIQSSRLMLFNADWEAITICPSHLIRFSNIHKQFNTLFKDS